MFGITKKQTNGAESQIMFFYDSKKVFNDVSLMSAYMTKNLSTEKGSIMDEFSISDDEQDVVDVCIRQTLPNIYEAMMKITSGVTSAFDDDLSGTELGSIEWEGTSPISDVSATANDKFITFRLQNNDKYNNNILNLIDATLLNCIKHGVLAEFYSICMNVELYRIAQDKLTTNLFQLKQRLFQLKKKAVTSQLS